MPKENFPKMQYYHTFLQRKPFYLQFSRLLHCYVSSLIFLKKEDKESYEPLKVLNLFVDVCIILLFQILCAVDPKLLKLTPHDEIIYTSFRNEFPDMKVDIINENELKSPEQKEVGSVFIGSSFRTRYE